MTAQTALAQRLAQLLADRNDTLFGLPGGGPNLDLVGAATSLGMRFVLAHSEGACAIMAGTYGLLTRAPTGVVVTRGPGATSAVNGIAQATLDRYPLIAVTDTVASRDAATVSHQRIDQRALFAPVTKVSVAASDAQANEVLEATADAAHQWPYGAVHFDYDASGDTDGGLRPVDLDETLSGTLSEKLSEKLNEAIELVAGARNPLVIIGMEAAANDHRNGPRIRTALEALGCPVLSTYQAIGTVPTDSVLHAGIYTNASVEEPVLAAADLILTVGLDTVEPIPRPWRHDVPVVSLSTASPIDDFLPTTVMVSADPAVSLKALAEGLAVSGWKPAWDADAGAIFNRDARSRLRPEPTPRFGPVDLVETALASTRSVDGYDTPPTITVDAGAHFLSIMPFWEASAPFEVLISNGLATMGFSIPAAIGAALARPQRPVLAFTGDGGMAMVMAELETIARLNLPITIVVFNDAALSLIEAKQTGPDHGGDDAIRFRPTDFATIATASGVHGHRVDTADELGQLLTTGWEQPRLIDARIDPSDYRHLLHMTRG